MAEVHSFDVGSFQCTMIQDGGMISTVEHIAGLFPDVPRETFERYLLDSGYDLQALPFSINILLIYTGTHRVLVDTGEGPGKGRLLDGIRALGIEPEDVDTVVLTHGHRDHIGGIVDEAGSLMFPNAGYFMWATEWDFLMDAGQQPDERGQSIRHNLFPIRDRVTLIEAEGEIVPGITAIPAPGHTVGHIALLLDSDGERLLHMVDAAHQPVQITVTQLSPRFDYQADLARTTRRQLVERAAREKLRVAAYHFGFPGLGRVVDREGRLVWEDEKTNG